jgi:hypothetical protein
VKIIIGLPVSGKTIKQQQQTNVKLPVGGNGSPEQGPRENERENIPNDVAHFWVFAVTDQYKIMCFHRLVIYCFGQHFSSFSKNGKETKDEMLFSFYFEQTVLGSTRNTSLRKLVRRQQLNRGPIVDTYIY